MDKLASAMIKLYMPKEAALSLEIMAKEPFKRTPEYTDLLKKLTATAGKRKKDLNLQRLLGTGGGSILAGVGSAISEGAAAGSILGPIGGGVLGLGVLTAILAKTLVPHINDTRLRNALKNKYGEEDGEEIANLSQRVFNKSRGSFRRLFSQNPLVMLGDIGEGDKRESAASDLLRKIEMMEIDPSRHVGPYSMAR